MQVHDLKLSAEAWHAIDAGVMTAHVRRNDRDYDRGDVLILRRLNTDEDKVAWREMNAGLEPPDVDDETRPMLVQITDVYEGGRYGIEDGHVLLSHRRVVLAV